jgi:TPR repeat protein
MLRLSLLLVVLVECASAAAQQPAGSAQPHALPPTESPAAPDEAATLDAAAIESRGFEYWRGLGVARDDAEAFRLFELAAAQGRPMAALFAGSMLREGLGVAHDDQRAREFFQQAAEHGVALAQMYLGYYYLVDRDTVHALQWLRAAAAQEEPMALYYLSGMYLRGFGVERDAALYEQMCMRAAELGAPPARIETGLRLLHQSPRDPAKGLHFLERGAEAEDPSAEYALGLEYMTGRGVDRDYGRGVEWIGKAAEKKMPIARFWLALVYANGLGVSADKARAAALVDEAFETAAPREVNAFAWGAVTSRDDALRDGALAVDVMERALRNPNARTAAYLDTLAAAYAEKGDFERAVATQQAAIDASRKESSAADSRGFESRLALYRDRMPYREGP